MPDKPTPEQQMWKEVSGELFPQVHLIRKHIKDYSYEDFAASQLTDEKVCDFFVRRLSKIKKSLFSVSDLCFSLHVGEDLIPLTQHMRDEVDIFSDEIKIRHCEWRGMFPDVLKNIVKHDHKLLTGLDSLDRKVRNIEKQILKKSRPRNFWPSLKKDLLKARKDIRELVILFKQRETLCNLHALALERTFQSLKKEIRWRV